MYILIYFNLIVKYTGESSPSPARIIHESSCEVYPAPPAPRGGGKVCGSPLRGTGGAGAGAGNVREQCGLALGVRLSPILCGIGRDRIGVQELIRRPVDNLLVIAPNGLLLLLSLLLEKVIPGAGSAP